MKKADNGNRTRLSGLGSQRSTDEPYLQSFFNMCIIAHFFIFHKAFSGKLQKIVPVFPTTLFFMPLPVYKKGRQSMKIRGFFRGGALHTFSIVKTSAAVDFADPEYRLTAKSCPVSNL